MVIILAEIQRNFVRKSRVIEPRMTSVHAVKSRDWDQLRSKTFLVNIYWSLLIWFNHLTGSNCHYCHLTASSWLYFLCKTLLVYFSRIDRTRKAHLWPLLPSFWPFYDFSDRKWPPRILQKSLFPWWRFICKWESRRSRFMRLHYWRKGSTNQNSPDRPDVHDSP